jgi:hypothetical protein
VRILQNGTGKEWREREVCYASVKDSRQGLEKGENERDVGNG